ncbi:ankyrin repeat-containing domain protein [Aspergillus spectabilis]
MDESGFTPLATAVVEGHPEVVKLLLANGADINTRDKLYQLSPIFWAISFEREDIANVLIDEESIDLASRDRYGRTPLHCAVEHRLHLVLRWLLRKGADANIPDDEGQTPLDKARMADDIAMEDLLKDWNNPQFS